uniref:OTU domain-containing protein n=1 Tax=Aegilops tauschii subsp. strangulata TaxID=200361 RepID=A0A453AM88_AEGTS
IFWLKLEKLSQVQVGVKVRPKQDKLPHVQGKSFWSRFKNKIFCREGRQICPEHVQHQTQPITEVMNRYTVCSNGMNSLNAYSEFRPVIGDGECFYRSFIFSYLEQVLDRPDTDEERRLLDVVEKASARHADLGWNSKFSRSSRAFKKLLEKVMRWKKMESTSSCRKEELLKFFSTYDKTLDIFAFLRLLVAIQICSHSEEYVPHIPVVASGDCSLEVWCFRRVTPAGVESEYLMMRALASALEVILIVETFQERYTQDIYTDPGVPRPAVTLLYNGNHYDIIYPCATSSGSSSHQAS